MKVLCSLLLLVSIANAVVAISTCGTFSAPSGLRYDLAPLTRPISNPWAWNSTDGTQYYWNFCATLSEVPLPIVLLDPDTTAVQIGSDALYAVGSLTSYNLTEVAPGTIQLMYYTTGKSNCPSGLSRNTAIVVTCDKDEEGHNFGPEEVEGEVVGIKEITTCTYQILMVSKHACPITNYGPTTPPQPPSAGPTHSGKPHTPVTPQPHAPVTSPHPSQPASPQGSPKASPTSVHPTHNSPAPTVLPPTPSASASSSVIIIDPLIIILVVLLLAGSCVCCCRIRRSRRNAYLLLVQQLEQQQQQRHLHQQQLLQQQQHEIDMAEYYPSEQQQMYMMQQQQTDYPPFIPQLHQPFPPPFYMIAPQLTQQQQQQLLRQQHH